MTDKCEGDRSHPRARDLETTFQDKFGGKDIQGQAENSKRQKPLGRPDAHVAGLREVLDLSNSPRERSILSMCAFPAAVLFANCHD
jgi:hypothetical protein